MGQLKVKDLTYNFLPGWWAKHYGIKYGERYITDPEYRLQVLAEVRELMTRDMPDLLINEPPPAVQYANLDFGNATTGAYVGCELRFPDDDAPCNKHLPPEMLASLALPRRIEEAYPYNEIVSQTNYLNVKYGCNKLPTIPTRGVLNEAFLIEGDKILTDMYEEPEEAWRILDFSYAMLEKITLHNIGVGYRGLVRILNCTIALISPEMYEEWLLPYDRRIFDLADRCGLTFGVHHCGTITGKLIDVYRNIPRFDYFQVGFRSDIDKMIHDFPEAELRYCIDPVYCMNATADEIANEIDETLYQMGEHATDIAIDVGALGFGTPMDNLRVIRERLAM